MYARLIVIALMGTLIATTTVVLAGGQDVPSCFGGSAPDESAAHVEDFYVTEDPEVWIESNQIQGLQRTAGACVGANGIVVQYGRDFFVAGAP